MLQPELVKLSEYNIDTENIKPWHGGFIVNVDKERFYYRKSVISPSRILFVHRVKEYLLLMGFGMVDRYRISNDGLPYILYEEMPYTLAKIPPGNECNFDNDEEVMKSAVLLSDFHKASKGFTKSEEYLSKDELGKSKVVAVKRLEEIKKAYRSSRYGKTDFDKMFNLKAEYFIGLAEECIELYGSKAYEACIKKAREDSRISHHDMTYQNIFVNGDDYYLVNFENCCYDTRMYDLSNLIKRKMRKCNWDYNMALKIVDVYSKAESISDDELYVLKLFLRFPQKLWRVINRYANSNKMWSQKYYTQKLKEVMDEIPSHTRFLKDFDLISK